MRYAFYMYDMFTMEDYVVKLPKNLKPSSYNLDVMKNDMEAMFICNHIVSDFNEQLIKYYDVKFLIEFVHSFIVEILDENSTYKYYYGENFINGIYEKYNNNAGWKSGKTGKDSNQTLIA